MKSRPTLDEFNRILREISMPADVVAINPNQALGMQLARPVVLRSVFPDRPFSIADGLAVSADDVVVRGGSSGHQTQSKASRLPGNELTNHVGLESADSVDVGQSDSEPARLGSISLKLRPAPSTNRREDAIQPGQAVAVGIGEEVPRGADLIYPLELLAPDPLTAPEVSAPEVDLAEPAEAGATPATEDESNGEIPAEPVRNWDLPARYGEGWVEVDKIPRTFKAHIPIGSWARSRDSLIREKTVLRPGDLALLEAARVTEVEVFRRPTVGVADFSPPFPRASSGENPETESVSGPVGSLAVQLVRAAMVPALALKNPPCDFHSLIRRVKHWLGQVDVLLLVGGSHYGSGCIGHDVINAAGEMVVDGLDLEEGGGLAIGMVEGKPVCSLPGSLPDVLVATVLGIRPLLHRHLAPRTYQDEVELELEHGSQLFSPVSRAIPVKYGFDRKRRTFTTRYTGRSHDPWLEFIQGEALIVLEGGRDYHDGESVPATIY